MGLPNVGSKIVVKVVDGAGKFRGFAEATVRSVLGDLIAADANVGAPFYTAMGAPTNAVEVFRDDEGNTWRRDAAGSGFATRSSGRTQASKDRAAARKSLSVTKKMAKAEAKAEAASSLANSTPNTSTVKWHAKAVKAWKKVVELAKKAGNDDLRAGAAARAQGHVEAGADEKMWRKFKPGLSVNDREAVEACLAQVEDFDVKKRVQILKAAAVIAGAVR